jgi:hypothetical protein
MADEKRRYWLSFDLGLTGEYTELYAWLDYHQAKECGDGVATFRSDKSREKIKKEIGRLLNPKRNPRIYLISMHQGGKFIFGRRKVAPWTGYSQTLIDSDEER